MKGEEMADRSLAKALRRKIGLDEGILAKIEAKRGESSLLMNPSRRKIFEHVCNHPCSHLRTISRATGYSTQTVRWHLRKLMEGGLISESSNGRKKFYSPLKNIIQSEECDVLAILNRGETKEDPKRDMQGFRHISAVIIKSSAPIRKFWTNNI
jgi:DNA-binding transcriptional ArsR family regulator